MTNATAAQKAGAARKAANELQTAREILARRDNRPQAWSQRVDHQWVLGAVRRAIRALVISDTAKAAELRDEAVQILIEGIEWSLARAAAAHNEDEKRAEMLVLEQWVLDVEYLQQYVRPVIDAWVTKTVEAPVDEETQEEGDEAPADDIIDVEDIQPTGAPLFLVADDTERPTEAEQVANLDGAIENLEIMELAVEQAEARMEQIAEQIDALNQERAFMQEFHRNARETADRLAAEVKELRFA